MAVASSIVGAAAVWLAAPWVPGPPRRRSCIRSRIPDPRWYRGRRIDPKWCLWQAFERYKEVLEDLVEQGRMPWRLSSDTNASVFPSNVSRKAGWPASSGQTRGARADCKVETDQGRAKKCAF